MMSRSEQKLFFPVGGKARNFFVFQVSFLSSRLAWKFDRDVSDGLLSAFEIWENNIPRNFKKRKKKLRLAVHERLSARHFSERNCGICLRLSVGLYGRIRGCKWRMLKFGQ